MLGSFRGSTRDSTESEVDLALFALKQIQQEASNIRFQVYRGRRLVDRCVCLIKPLKVRVSACLLHGEAICVLTFRHCLLRRFVLAICWFCLRLSKREVTRDVDGSQLEQTNR